MANSLQAQNGNKVTYTINMKGPSMDTFHIEVKVGKLKKENNIYQFASTAPGTYTVFDFGRFVSGFKAYGKKGREVPTRKIQTNQWEISQPHKVRTIRYAIAETFDTPLKQNMIYPMCGTSLEKDHALLNMNGLLGYVNGMQQRDIAIKLEHPDSWQIGTAMASNKEGYYLASDYDQAVDSPILAGRLSKASTTLGETKVDIYTYSKTDLVQSDTLLGSMQSMLQAAAQFLKKLPVDRYVFLFHFEDEEWGAWEHAYSSAYTLQERPLTPQALESYTHMAAHEFFHIVTPLNIHSEVIEEFNFVTPTPSEHLWLYEGVTEWASQIMQLRAGLMSVNNFFKILQEKLTLDENRFDKQYSLSKLSLTSYTPDGNAQYVNIYMRGAVVATLLDIRLLELSRGKRGLREVILELTEKYGPDKAFSEKDFFDILVQMTYPQIRQFIDSYIRGTEPLPVVEYFAKIGYDCLPKKKSGQMEADLGINIKRTFEIWTVAGANDSLTKAGVGIGDEIIAINDLLVEHPYNPKIDSMLTTIKVGDIVKFSLLKGDKTYHVNHTAGSKHKMHQFVFAPSKEPTPQQVRLGEAWLKNLK